MPVRTVSQVPLRVKKKNNIINQTAGLIQIASIYLHFVHNSFRFEVKPALLFDSQAKPQREKINGRVPHQSGVVLHLWDASEMRSAWCEHAHWLQRPRSAAKPQPRCRCFWCKVGVTFTRKSSEPQRTAAGQCATWHDPTWLGCGWAKIRKEAAVASLWANRPVLIQVLSELNNRSLFSGDTCQLSPLPPIGGSASIGEPLESPAAQKVSLSTHFMDVIHNVKPARVPAIATGVPQPITTFNPGMAGIASELMIGGIRCTLASLQTLGRLIVDNN